MVFPLFLNNKSPWSPMKSPRNPPFLVKITESPGENHLFLVAFPMDIPISCWIFPMNSPLPRAGLPHGAVPLPPLRLKRRGRGRRAAAPLGCWALAAWREKWDAVGKTIWKNYGKLWRGNFFWDNGGKLMKMDCFLMFAAYSSSVKASSLSKIWSGEIIIPGTPAV